MEIRSFDGQVLKSEPLPSPERQVGPATMAGGTIIAFRGERLEFANLLAPAISWRSRPVCRGAARSLRLVSNSRDTVVAMDMCSGSGCVLPLSDRPSADFTLESPRLSLSRAKIEERQAQVASSPSRNILLLGALAISESDELITFLLPYERSIGLRVESFGLNGFSRRSFDCILPDMFRFVPAVMFASDGELLLIAPEGAAAAYEPIDCRRPYRTEEN
ncbi:MAG: hypothetical protein SFV18_10655 [Bryobacteraceae bacterium]|nr:hypothetical protein [Bryobacteraceae bacterium]